MIDEFGTRSFKIDAVPMDLAFTDTKTFLEKFTGFSHEEEKEKGISFIEKIFRAACRSAVMIGDALSESEMSTLIQELNRTDNRYTCPHGRPVTKRFTWNDLRSFFKRG